MPTTLEKYVEQSQASAQPLKDQSAAFLKRAKTIVVSDDDSLKDAILMKKEIVKQSKSVDTMRKQLTKPLDDVKKQIMMLEQDVMVDLDEAKSYISGQILDYEAEQQRKREAEAERVREMVASVTVGTLNATSIDENKKIGAGMKAAYGKLSAEDREIPEVKQAFLSSINSIGSQIARIEEDERQRAENERLAKIAAEQSAEAARLAKEKSDNEAEQRRIQREREQLEEQKRQQALEDERKAREAAAAKAAAAAPKANIITNYSFEIVDPAKVPIAYMSPDEKKIGAAIKQSKGQIEIAGVKIIEKKITR